jgi:predicted permease
MLATIGFVWVKLGFEYRVEFVTRLSMTLSVPCLIFVALMRTEIAASSIRDISLAALAAYAVLTAVLFGLVSGLRLDRSTYLAPLIFGNTGNLGLPLALFAFGQVGLGYAVVIFAIMAVISFTFGIWLVSGGGSLRRVLGEPMVGATVLGGIFLWQGWQTPVWLTNGLELVGQMGIPLMLITLGVAVARLKPARLGRAVWLSALRTGLCIATGVAIGRLFALEPVAFAVLVLQVSTPVAVTSYMLAEKYKADAEAVAGLVVVSTLLSIVTIPVTLAFLI